MQWSLSPTTFAPLAQLILKKKLRAPRDVCAFAL
jgi:hypothetical protein